MSLHYFAEKERESQKQFAEKRDRWFSSIYGILESLKLHPNHITFLSAALLIPFALLFYSHTLIAVACLLFYTILDGLDGAYARHLKKSSDSGALLDVVNDQLGLIIASLLIIHYELVQPALGAYYLMAYILMICLTIIQNNLKLSVPILLRSKFVLYAGILAWGLGVDAMVFTFFMGFFSITMTYTCASAIFSLYRYLQSNSDQS